jgi:hypothetical protein
MKSTQSTMEDLRLMTDNKKCFDCDQKVSDLSLKLLGHDVRRDELRSLRLLDLCGYPQRDYS